MFNVQELATAAKYQLNLVTIVFNDNTYTNVQRQQDEWFGGRRICSDLHNPDFQKLGDAYGVRTLRVSSPDELRKALPGAFDADGPTLIEVALTERFPTPWRFILMEQNRKALCP